MKKITCGILATVSAFACAATMAGCETSHPEVEMTIEFDGKTYELDYKLYRKVAPATVDHFLWLAGNGYYDGLCIHDYDTGVNRWYTGAYSATPQNDLIYKKYYESVASYENYKDFPHSVWKDEGKNTPAYTVRGEFKDNHFNVENGALQETFGSLTMYYYNVSDYVAEEKLYVDYASEDKKGNGRSVEYQYNNATSLFYISLSTTSKTNDNYCTFATLKDKSADTLNALKDAINEYIEENYDSENEDEFTHSLTKEVFEDDDFLRGYAHEESFNVPYEPIVIKQVKVSKY